MACLFPVSPRPPFKGPGTEFPQKLWRELTGGQWARRPEKWVWRRRRPWGSPGLAIDLCVGRWERPSGAWGPLRGDGDILRAPAGLMPLWGAAAPGHQDRDIHHGCAAGRLLLWPRRRPPVPSSRPQRGDKGGRRVPQCTAPRPGGGRQGRTARRHVGDFARHFAKLGGTGRPRILVWGLGQS